MAQLPPFLVRPKNVISQKQVNFMDSSWAHHDLMSAVVDLSRDTNHRVQINHTRIEEWTARVRRTATYRNSYTVSEVEELLDENGEWRSDVREARQDVEDYLRDLTDEEEQSLRMWWYLNDIGMTENMPNGRREIAEAVDAEVARLYKRYVRWLFDHFTTTYVWDDEAAEYLSYDEDYDDVFVDDYDTTVDSWNDYEDSDAVGGFRRMAAPLVAAVQRYREVRSSLRNPSVRADEERSR